MNPERRLVFPGEELATSEELTPGDGTFDDGKVVRAARIGYFEIDPEDFRALVAPVTSTPVVPALGDFVICRIDMVREKMASVTVAAVVGKDRLVSGSTLGTLHVSKIADRYVQDVGHEYRLGDIIRARVIDVKPSLQVSTDFPGGGAIKAFCTNCRFGLKRVGEALECANCGRRDVRNVAPDYGQGQMTLSEEILRSLPPPRPRERRGPREGGDRGFGRGGGGRPPRGDRGGRGRRGDREQGGERGGERRGFRGGRGRRGDGGRRGDRESGN